MSNHAKAAALVVFSLAAAAFAAPPPEQAAATSLRAEVALPLEREVREQFPSVALDSRATLEPVQELVAGRMASGMRARGALRVFYPASYDEAFVVELGEQRVVLRAVGAHFARAEASAGKLFYSSPHDAVDVIEVPSAGRSEELMVLHDPSAPRVFEYEIVEMRGVAGPVMQDGAIRFTPEVPLPAVTQMAGGRFRALPSSLQIDRPWVVDARGRRSESAARWSIVREHDQPRAIRLTISADALTYPLLVDPSFSATGTMTSARQLHTATLLSNGKVLIAGGVSAGLLNSAELYDPSAGTFTSTSMVMTSARVRHTATVLTNGKVLIAGGQSGSGVVNTAEIYDPASGTFTATSGAMTSARAQHTATLLPNGKVLITGGIDALSATLSTAELYDPVTNTFGRTRDGMTATRHDHTAVLLSNGKVLIAGGSDGSVGINTAELYDPASGRDPAFAATSSQMTSPRSQHTATLLPNGTVLIAGGIDGRSAIVNTAEIYDPAAPGDATFTATSMPMTSGRAGQSATLLPNGNVLIAGGSDGTGLIVNSAERYDAVSGTFTSTNTTMQSARTYDTATLLPDGTVLIVGGLDASFVPVNTADLYDDAIGTFTTSGLLASARMEHSATLLPNGKVLIAGGDSGSGISNSAEIYDPAVGTFTPPFTLMTSARYRHTATLLPDGRVLLAGGSTALGEVNTADLYDPDAMTFTATSAPMTMARSYHTATLLPNGQVLITGGENSTALKTAELYDPASGTFTATSSPMTSARTGHTATLLATGKVLIAGGNINNGSLSLRTAELYDPDAGTFTAIAGLIAGRQFHTATLLPNGRVLIHGGQLSLAGSSRTSIQLYDPDTGTFTTANDELFTIRNRNTATLLANGDVLLVGGEYEDSADLYDSARGEVNHLSIGVHRGRHTATLLKNGKVLLAGGLNTFVDTGHITHSTVESSTLLFDPGLGFSEARRPVLSSLTAPLCQPATLTLGGSFLEGDSEGSGGSTSNSAANAPLLRLQRVDNDGFQFVLPQTFSASTFSSTTLNNLPSGSYRAAIVSNAISSVEQIIAVETTPVLAAYENASSVSLFGSTSVTPSSIPPDYHGAFYPQTAAGSSGFTGTLFVNGTTGGVMVANAGPVGDFSITVSTSTACGSQTTSFPLKVIGPPSSIAATGGTPQSAELNAGFAAPLQVTITDSAGHPLNNITVNFSAPTSGASATLSAGSAPTNALGLASITANANGAPGNYNVTATVAAKTATFVLTNTPVPPPPIAIATATTPKSVTITWTAAPGSVYEVLRVATGGVLSTIGSSDSGSLTDTTAIADTAYLYKVRRILPGVSDYGPPDLATTVIFTDPSLISGTTAVKADHITQLRTAVDAVRALAAAGGGSYSDATITAGLTPIRAAHITDLRMALDDARSRLQLTPNTYTRPAIVGGATVISAADINDLRIGVR